MEGQRFETKRVKLSEQIPLDTPYSVTMVPSSYCNFACTFCPARVLADHGKARMLRPSQAKRIMDNAKFTKQVKMLSLYNVGEPLFNHDLPEIIEYAKNTGFCERTSLVTNASRLFPDVSEKLLRAGIDRIIISLYGLNDQDYELTTNKKADFEWILKNITYLSEIKKNCIVHIKIIDRVTGTPEREKAFVDMFGPLCDTYSIEPILPIWPNFRPEGESCDARGLYKGVPAVDRLACHYPFYSMVVNPDGRVTPCLADWNEDMVLGDTSGKQGLSDIWNSFEYNEFRWIQLKGLRRDHHLCSTCGTLRTATCPEDDIDEDRIKLLNKLFPGGGI